MARRLRIRAIRRKEVDEDKLALAFLLLAQQLAEPDAPAANQSDGDRPEREAA
jgi:hypothetical protein